MLLLPPLSSLIFFTKSLFFVPHSFPHTGTFFVSHWHTSLCEAMLRIADSIDRFEHGSTVQRLLNSVFRWQANFFPDDAKPQGTVNLDIMQGGKWMPLETLLLTSPNHCHAFAERFCFIANKLTHSKCTCSAADMSAAYYAGIKNVISSE